MYLAQPEQRYIKSYIEFCVGFKAHNLADFFLNSRSSFELERMYLGTQSPQALLDELEQNRRDDSRKVPQSQFWLIDGCDEVVGVGNIRHCLTPALEFFGGHVGYGVRIGLWGKGYGTILLRELLCKMPALGIKTALLTCDSGNRRSSRVMEKNGGRHRDTVVHEMNGVERVSKRYLIDTSLTLGTAFCAKNHDLFRRPTGDEHISLVPGKAVDEGGWIISYYFNILLDGVNIGWIVFRAAGERWLYCDGNIGYFIKAKYRGHGYAKAACLLLGAVLNRMRIPRVFITCDIDNVPSRRICESIGAKLLELAEQRTKTDSRLKCRYVWFV